MSTLLILLVLGFLMRLGWRWKHGGGESLPAVLAGAEAAGIITGDQRERILAHAAENDVGTGFGGAAWLGVFAGLFVVAGVSLLVARNWDSIGAPVRVVAFLLVMIAVGEIAIRTRERALAIALPFELLWFFLPFLGIGLYAQTFQLVGDPIRPGLVWCALTAPLAWLSPRPMVAAIHVVTMVGILFIGNFLLDSTAFLLGTTTGPRDGLLSLTGAWTLRGWALSALFLGAITLESLRLLPRAHRHHFVGVMAFWVFGLLVAPTPLRLQHEGWIALAALALGAGWIVALAALDASLEERVAAVLVWLGTIYALTFTWHMRSAPDGPTTTAGIAVAIAAVVASVAGTITLPAARLSPMPLWARGAKALLIAPMLVALLYLAADVRLTWWAAILMNFLLATVAVGLMWHGSLVADVVQINVGVLVLVWVLITRFLDVFGDMLRSGVGFIVAGVLLAALSWALERTRRRLIGSSRGATP